MPSVSKKERAAIDLAIAEDLVVARNAVTERVVTKSQVEHARKAQKALLEHGYFFRLGELLVKHGDCELEQWVGLLAGLGIEVSALAARAAAPVAAGDRGEGDQGAGDQDEADDRAVRELLHGAEHCLTQVEIARALGWAQRRTASVLAFLVDSGRVGGGRQGRTKVYWHPERPFFPQWELNGHVLVGRRELTEEQILEKAAASLRSTLFIFEAERLATHELVHLPLWKVELHGSFPEGLVFKKTRKRSGTLYFHGSRGHLCSLVPDTGLVFGAFGGEAPDAVQDLDGICEWEARHPCELTLNEKLMESLKPAARVSESLANNFGMTVDTIRLVFLPCWKIHIEDKDGAVGSRRLLILDGVMGLPIQL